MKPAPLPVIYRRFRSGDREPFALFPTLPGHRGPRECLVRRKDGSLDSFPPEIALRAYSEPACPDREPGVAKLRELAERLAGNRTLKTVTRFTPSYHSARHETVP